jgi:hypothetical protein
MDKSSILKKFERINTVESTEKLRLEIEQQTKGFLANGGVIDQVDLVASGNENLKSWSKKGVLNGTVYLPCLY